MCGVCGVVYSDPARPVERGLLQRMADSLRHRGPDSEGFHLAPGVGLGFRRVSIIDLETGDQPISNEDGTVRFAVNRAEERGMDPSRVEGVLDVRAAAQRLATLLQDGDLALCGRHFPVSRPRRTPAGRDTLRPAW